ncbi:MlaD family protein [Conexibacter sp. SYSU D00693]|uniref:MlaD family protein n=1 Tax=Conexibacter sp. SYSU D00693 TaxID=2812560 RepID=UPI00196B5920|nr:MlaD family protein [Conexibacter sp. SYSU D00693]
MQTRTPTYRQLVAPLLFVLACVLLSIFAWRAYDGPTPLEAKGYRFSVVLPSGGGLVPGADVRMSGVVIGRIAEVRRDGSRARATGELKAAYAPLRTGATAIARLKSLLGEAYLEVAPGPVDAPILQDGATLAADQVQPSQQLSDVLSTFDARTRKSARDLFAGLAEAVRGRGADLNAAIGDGAVAAGGTQELLRTLDRQEGQLRRLVASSAEVFDAAGDRQGAVRAAITQADRVLATTAARDRELRATVRALPPFLASLRRTSGAVDAASGDLNRAALALEPVAPRVAPLLRDVTARAPAFERLFRDLPPVLDTGRRTLGDVGRIARAAGPALDRVHPSLRQIIPFVQLLNENREEVVAVLGNVASLLNGRAYGPNDKLVRFGTGIPTVWNEVVGGWIRKLPTNRANPYLKPQGLRSLAGKGLVQAFDCRNLANPLYLPPIGTGAPRCDEQGTWEFRGKSAYYPNLEPAAP